MKKMKVVLSVFLATQMASPAFAEIQLKPILALTGLNHMFLNADNVSAGTTGVIELPVKNGITTQLKVTPLSNGNVNIRRINRLIDSKEYVKSEIKNGLLLGAGLGACLGAFGGSVWARLRKLNSWPAKNQMAFTAIGSVTGGMMLTGVYWLSSKTRRNGDIWETFSTTK